MQTDGCSRANASSLAPLRKHTTYYLPIATYYSLLAAYYLLLTTGCEHEIATYERCLREVTRDHTDETARPQSEMLIPRQPLFCVACKHRMVKEYNGQGISVRKYVSGSDQESEL